MAMYAKATSTRNSNLSPSHEYVKESNGVDVFHDALRH